MYSWAIRTRMVLSTMSLIQVNIGEKFILRYIDLAGGAETVESKFGTLGGLLSTVLSFILGVAAFLMFLFLIIGGLRYIFSGGDEKAVAAARGQITVAIAGFLVILLSWVIMKIIEFLTGLNIVAG